MFLEQISILEWLLNDHVTLKTGVIASEIIHIKKKKIFFFYAAFIDIRKKTTPDFWMVCLAKISYDKWISLMPLKSPLAYLCPAVMVTFSCGMGMVATLEAVNILVSDNYTEQELVLPSLKLKSRLLVFGHILTSSFQSSMPHSSVAVLQAPVTQTFSSLTMTTGEQIFSKAASARLTRGRVKLSRIVCSLSISKLKPCGNRFMSEHQLLHTCFKWTVYFSLKKCQHCWELEEGLMASLTVSILRFHVACVTPSAAACVALLCLGWLSVVRWVKRTKKQMKI